MSKHVFHVCIQFLLSVFSFLGVQVFPKALETEKALQQDF